MAWTDEPDDEDGNRINQCRRDDGFSLYFWTGLSWKWVLCDPDGRKVAMNDELEPGEREEAREWAEHLTEYPR